MSTYIPSESYLKILNEIGKWKVVPLRALFEDIGGGIGYKSFYKRTKILERHGLIQSYRAGCRTKCLALTGKGEELSRYICPYTASAIGLGHDLMASMVLRSLLKFPNFKSGHIFHAHDASKFSPDAIIYAVKRQEEYSLAIEVDLFHLSRNKIIEKFYKYSNTDQFTHMLYMTNRESFFDACRDLISKMDEFVSKKVILLVAPNLSHGTFEYQNGRCWFKGKAMTFDEVFG